MKWLPFVLTMMFIAAALIPRFWDLLRNPHQWDRDRRETLLVATAYFLGPMTLAFFATASSR